MMTLEEFRAKNAEENQAKKLTKEQFAAQDKELRDLADSLSGKLTPEQTQWFSRRQIEMTTGLSQEELLSYLDYSRATNRPDKP